MASVTEIATTTQTVIANYVTMPLLILILGIFFGTLAEQAIIALAKELKKDNPSIELGAHLLAWTIYLFALGAALWTLGALWYILVVLTSIFALLGLASLLLGLKEFFPNASRYGAVHKRYKQGGALKTTYGDMTVVAVHLLYTQCKNKAGDDIYIPNRSVPLGKKTAQN